MEEIQKPDSHGPSAAAFVEGGILDACDDACSICLDEFSESNPSTVTTCKHEFHLQCILEWCQRSSQCPMCWQAISLKEPASQELLEAVEKERSFRITPPRNTTIFHHPALGDFELQHLPVGVNDPELEERIIRHLAAAAAAMGRTRHAARREVQRRPSAHSHPHFLVYSTHPGPQDSVSVPSSPLTQIGRETETATDSIATSSTPLTSGGDQQMTPYPSGSNTPSSRSTVTSMNRRGYSFSNRSTSSNPSLPNQDRAGPSEFQSFSESFKSRFNSVSLRYKESISKSTRGWKERWFSRNSSMSDIGNEVQREVNAGIASVSHMMDCLETTENRTANQASLSNHLAESSSPEQDNQHNTTRNNNPLCINPTVTSDARSSLSD